MPKTFTQFFKFLVLFFLLGTSSALLGQQSKIVELEQKLEGAGVKEKMYIYNQMSLAALKVSADQVYEYADKALDLAIRANSKGAMAQALNLKAKAMSTRDGDNRLSLRNRKLKNERRAIQLFKESLGYAKQTGNTNLALDNLEHLILVSKATGNSRQTISYYQQFIDFAKRERKFGSASLQQELNSEFKKRERAFRTEKSKFEKSKKQLTREISALRKEKNQLDKDKSSLSKATKRLTTEKKATERELDQTEEALTELSEEKTKIEGTLKTVKSKNKNLKSEVEEVTNQLSQTELELQNAELRAVQNKIVLFSLIGLSALILMLAYLFYSRYRTKQKANDELEEKNKIIEEEKGRSDDLLLNILPASIAEELKQNGHAKARQHENVTVLFTDFKNFTKVSERLSPENLVKELDHCFKAFDKISSFYHIEKIKTIGDSYMCANGLDNSRINPALDMVKAAMEMQEFLEEYKADRKSKSLPFFEARIGIHTGSVVSGVVGTKKFAYDIWGDTVNIASRMESSGEPNRVNISNDTFFYIQSNFYCTYRGQIAAKNKGDIDMYFVDKEINAVSP